MKLGVMGLNSGAVISGAATRRLAPLCEQLGYDSWWNGEHVVLPVPQAPPSPAPPETPILDPLINLAYVAALTDRMALATGIIILPQRNPVVLAKEIASLDVQSGGRVWFGIGVGYLEPEFRAIGAPFHDRGARTDDYLAAMQALWTQPAPIAYDGPIVQFSGIDANPRPLQAGGPKVVIGGRTPPAFRRAVTKGHHWYGFFRTPEQTAGDLAMLHEAEAKVERPAHLGKLEISVTPGGPLTAEMVEQYAELGVDRIVVMPSAPNVDAAAERLEAAAKLVLG